jgi:arylsulfatase A-like enzyme
MTFEGGIRNPFIARWPGRIPPGTVKDDLASTLELFPSVLAAAGAKPPSHVILDGFNFLPLLEGQAKGPRKEMFWDYYWLHTHAKAARVGQWKWVDSTNGGGLFDLSTDLGESHDLSAEKPTILKDLQGRWAEWKQQMDAAELRGPFRDY